ncbi:GTP 3',8-cyclase MoaA [Ascidiimonas sp. W6]|uniref:GTP 3',8-cyclase MoaA n=1 Tax=Ascidiimonas meishanensis TaxID=3128903 RepID=UPI0030ECEBE7
MIVDNHNRTINYLRIAVTDRCNLRCNYCMPEQGIKWAANDKLLSIEELCLLAEMLVNMGIDKIRITGGEPFVRKDIMILMRHLASLKGLKEISVTTNATLIGPYIQELKQLGILKVNVSMDAIERATFEKITRRKQYDTVHKNLTHLISEGFDVKINCIVLENQNEQEIIPMVELTRHLNVAVRFLEEMPFNGGTKNFQSITWDYKKILSHITAVYPDIEKLEDPFSSTSLNYQVKGFEGTIGLIPSFTRTFCGTCNRLRITATGDVVTCLYAKASANIREILRSQNQRSSIEALILNAVSKKAKTGFEAQEKHKTVFSNSMTSIGG